MFAASHGAAIHARLCCYRGFTEFSDSWFGRLPVLSVKIGFAMVHYCTDPCGPCGGKGLDHIRAASIDVDLCHECQRLADDGTVHDRERLPRKGLRSQKGHQQR